MAIFFFYRLCDTRRCRGGEPPAPMSMVNSWVECRVHWIVDHASPPIFFFYPTPQTLSSAWESSRGKVGIWRSFTPLLWSPFSRYPLHLTALEKTCLDPSLIGRFPLYTSQTSPLILYYGSSLLRISSTTLHSESHFPFSTCDCGYLRIS